jgi:alkanesulfonate monooxygenase SsuD/methylene tetrahydromethanopterin reductase-like flavin-dependent oxidoreductase (luciferase family)
MTARSSSEVTMEGPGAAHGPAVASGSRDSCLAIRHRTSEDQATLAAGLGIGYTFAGFINPPGAAPALRQYRQAFQPQGFGLEAPRAILADVTVGETTEAGRYLAGSPKGYYARLSRAGREAGSVMIADPVIRRRSHELLAQVFNLPRKQEAPQERVA